MFSNSLSAKSSHLIHRANCNRRNSFHRRLQHSMNARYGINFAQQLTRLEQIWRLEALTDKRACQNFIANYFAPRTITEMLIHLAVAAALATEDRDLKVPSLHETVGWAANNLLSTGIFSTIQGATKAEIAEAKRTGGVQTREVIVIRHEHSLWNQLQHGTGGRRSHVLLRELGNIYNRQSEIVDAPLSDTGIQQAKVLREAINRDPTLKSQVTGENIVYAVSNLRRAVQTAGVAFGSVDAENVPVFHVLSALQELTNMADGAAVALESANRCSQIPMGCYKGVQDPERYKCTLDMTQNYKKKSVMDRTRILEFCDYVFTHRISARVVAIGHSLYFKRMFKDLISDESARKLGVDVRKNNLENEAIASFKLMRYRVVQNDGSVTINFAIDPASVKMLYKTVEGH